jgi:hypothetical protein
MKSVNTGTADTGAVPAGTGAMPVVAAGDGEAPGRGGDAAGGQPAARVPLRQLIDDQLDALLERSRDRAGTLTGEGSMLDELVRAVLERVLETEPAAHLDLGYSRPDEQGPISETEYHSIAQPDGNPRTAR